MIVGTGLVARTFAKSFSSREDVCIYAAGVSNSNCEDANEFEREHRLLSKCLEEAKSAEVFVYFGTCSVYDPEMEKSKYVQHKLLMEQNVRQHPRYLIFRLPQVAGITSNPHTLLNFLYAHISRSEVFYLWKNARRYIIDIDDVEAIASKFILNSAVRNTTINITNTRNYSLMEIIQAMESVTGKRAIYYSIDRGSDFTIDTTNMSSVLKGTGVKFDENYLERLLTKYYEKRVDNPRFDSIALNR